MSAVATLQLQGRLGYRFRDPSLQARALTHRSALPESKTSLADYERLEFLGDSLLAFLVSDWLYKSAPRASEGLLTRRRQAVVRAETLAEAARGLGLGEALRLGRGEERTGGRGKPSLLADAFEALLGAVYLDGGLRAARAFVRRHLREVLERQREADGLGEDWKTLLQERVQRSLRLTPRYRLAGTSGPPHAPSFRAEVVLGDDVLGSGEGSTRKQAEQHAARVALAQLDASPERT